MDHRNSNGRRVADDDTVAHREGKAIGTAVVTRWTITEMTCATRALNQCGADHRTAIVRKIAVARAVSDTEAQVGAINVTRAQIYDRRCVFISANRLTLRDWSVVNVGHRDLHHRYIAGGGP